MDKLRSRTSCLNMTRRMFLRTFCLLSVTVSAAVNAGKSLARSMSIRDHMYERIACVYREDPVFSSMLPQDNEQVRKLYGQFLGQPLNEKAVMLLHTAWKDKSADLERLKSDKKYPGPRGGRFRYLKYPHEDD